MIKQRDVSINIHSQGEPKTSFCNISTESLIISNPKYKSKKSIKDKLAESESNATRPPIDLIITETGQFTSPEELRKLANCTNIPVTNRERTFFGNFVFSEKLQKWKFV